MSTGSGGGGGGTSTTSVEMPAWLRPYSEAALKSYYKQTYGAPFDPNNPDTQDPINLPPELAQKVAGFTPYQLQAMGGIVDQSGQNQALVDQGLGETSKTIQGDYLNPETNPYLKGTYDAAAQSVADTYSTATAPGITAAAQRAGQFGSSGMDESLWMARYGLGNNLDQLAANIYGTNYAAERANQIKTVQSLPQTVEGSYYPDQQVMSVGAQQQEQQQAEYDTGYLNDVAQFEWPFNLLSGALGASTTAGGGAGNSNTVTKSKGGGGMSVLCTELHRRHMLTDAEYEADCKYAETVKPEVIVGYHRFGIPLANLMKKSEIVTMLIAPIVQKWAEHMAGKPNWIGSLLLKFGVPVCAFLGRKAATR